MPVEVLKRTQEFCLGAAGRGVEGQVFWTGAADGQVKECRVPPQKATAAYVRTEPEDLARIALDAAASGDVVLAQVHSHLGPAFHSGIDDAEAACTDKGFLSVVLADGGAGDLVDLEGLRVYECQAPGKWREVRGIELQNRIRVLEDMYDRTTVFEQTVKPKGGPRCSLLVSLSDKMAGSVNGQMILLQALNLLPRLARRYLDIDVSVPPGIPALLRPYAGQDLTSAAMEVLRTVQPYGTYHAHPDPAARYDLCLAIGDIRDNGRLGNVLYINSDGWVGHVGESPRIGDLVGRDNVVGAQGAAALAVARLYLTHEGLAGPDDPDLSFNFFELRAHEPSLANPDLPGKVDFGDIELLGAGALANSLINALRFLPNVVGRFRVTDEEAVDLTNNNRYVLMGYQDGVARINKVPLLKKAWAHEPEISFDLREKAFGPDLSMNPGVVVTAVDRVFPRLEAQRRMPKVLINGGTNGRMFMVSCHRSEDIRAGITGCVGCALGSDEPQRRQREGTISFVSSLAGISLASLVIRQAAYPGEATVLRVDFDSFSMRWPHCFDRFPPNPGCPLGAQIHV